jgi:hypothetical protein
LQQKKLVEEKVQFPERMNINVGGQIFSTTLSTLKAYPESMLGAMFRYSSQLHLAVAQLHLVAGLNCKRMLTAMSS